MEKEKITIWKKLLGIIFIIIGVLGIIFPILPGWILIFVGIEFLGIQLVFMEKIKSYIKSKISASDGEKHKKP